MRLGGKFLSGVCVAALVALAGSAHAQAARATPTMDDIFKSMKQSAHADGPSIAWTPLLLGLFAAGLMAFAVKHWKRRKATPVSRTLNNHRRLIRDAARSSGVSRRQLKRIAPLAAAQGLSSPLVAIICPSAIKGMAAGVRTAEQQAALRSIASTLLQQETRDV